MVLVVQQYLQLFLSSYVDYSQYVQDKTVQQAVPGNIY